MVAEEKPVMVAYWGLIPVLDIAAGAWIISDWSDADVSEWNTAYYTELALGSISLLAWSAASFMDTSSAFVIVSKTQVVAEAVMLYLVYNGEDSYPNADYVDT